jgi:hypothetical protein
MTGVSDRRRRQWLLVGLSVIVILGSVTRVAGLLERAWADHGLVYHLTFAVAGAVGGTVASVDAFVLGLILAWVVLFALDDYKRIQAALLALVAVPTLVVAFSRLDRLQVDWAAHAPAGLVGAVVGMSVGQAGHRLRRLPSRRGDGNLQLPVVSRYHIEFPQAGRLLYGAISLVAILGFIERYLPYESPFVAANAPAGTSVGPSLSVGGLVLDLVAVVALVAVVNYFVEYSDRKTVAVFCPDGRPLANLLGGLFAVAKRQFGGRSLRNSERFLNEASTALYPDDLPEVKGRIAFRFQRPGPFSWRTEVVADTPGPLSREDVEALERRVADRSSIGSWVAVALRARLTALVPKRIRDLSGPRIVTDRDERVDRADVVLFVVPLGDVIEGTCEDLRAGEYDRLDEVVHATGRERAERYAQVAELYDDRPKRVTIVASDAHVARCLFEGENGQTPDTESQLERFIANSVLDIGRRDVLPVNRRLEGSSDGENFDRLLSKI